MSIPTEVNIDLGPVEGTTDILNLWFVNDVNPVERLTDQFSCRQNHP